MQVIICWLQLNLPRQRPGIVLSMFGCMALVLGGCGAPSTGQSAHPTSPAESALLGSPEATFEAAFGRPNEHSIPSQGRYNFQSYGSDGDHIVVYLGTFYGYSYKQAFSISVAPTPGTQWSVAEAKAACLVFAPKPVHFKQEVPWKEVKGFVGNKDEIYYSAPLAKLFPPQAFQDIEMKPVQPGTLDILLYSAQNSNASPIDKCSIAVGQQQTL
jgi:hypothetical protein